MGMDRMMERIGGIAGRIAGLPRGTAAPDDDLFAAGLTSLTMVELLMTVEAEFGVRFPEEALQAATFTSVRRIAETVAAIAGGRPGAP